MRRHRQYQQALHLAAEQLPDGLLSDTVDACLRPSSPLWQGCRNGWHVVAMADWLTDKCRPLLIEPAGYSRRSDGRFAAVWAWSCGEFS